MSVFMGVSRSRNGQYVLLSAIETTSEVRILRPPT